MRPTDKGKYELIVGERRWRACKALKIKVRAEIRDIDDKLSAIIQISENLQRKDLSDYAQGISYSSLIKEEIITQRDIANSVGRSQSYVRNMLSFSKINNKIQKAINDFRCISSTTAYEIVAYQEKGDSYIQAIIKLADKLRLGQIGYQKLGHYINKMLDSEPEKTKQQDYFLEDGRKLFTIKNGNIQIPFSIKRRINIDEIAKALHENMSTQLEEFNKKIKLDKIN